MDKDKTGREFSVEMGSKRNVKTISVSDESHDRVLFEGNLGELQELGMVEDIILEIKGTSGTLRVEVCEDELQKMLSSKKGTD